MNARSSILLNGNLTNEFHLHRGLRQGDPLFPFLFVIVMEGLHVAIEDAVATGFFRGVLVGSNTLSISHLFYANDALVLVNGMN